MSGRRARNREELMRRIRAAALARLRDHGADGLTMRGIAADLDLSPGALYRYYDGLDALLTALIADGCSELADTIERADPHEGGPHGGTGHRERLRRTWRAYRSWALAHPHDFELVFGAPIPGYAAPEEGPTTQAMELLAAAMFRPAVEACLAGHLEPPAAYAIDDPGNRVLVEKLRAMSGAELPESFAAWTMVVWGQLHGLVALELNGQFRWMYDDDAGVQYDAAIDGLLDAAMP